jgi:hypothetical protein
MTVGIECQIAAVAFMQDFLREPRRLQREQVEVQLRFLSEAIATLRNTHPKCNPQLEHCSALPTLRKPRPKKS